MSTGTKLPLAVAEKVARALVQVFEPACERIEIAGSILRRKPEVGDIEIVAAPRFVDGAAVDLFAPPPRVSVLDDALRALEREGRLVHHPEKPRADGERYKRRWAPKAGVQVDLFIVLPPAQWAVIKTIRTGPADFSAMLVTRMQRYGRRCSDGRILDGDRVIDCEDEADVFAAAGLHWMPPERRGVDPVRELSPTPGGRP